MAIPHAPSGQVIDLHLSAGGLTQPQSHALFKTTDLEVMRLVIPAQKSVPQHHVDGDLTMQCLEGEVLLQVDGQPANLAAGQMLWLTGGVEYSISATTDAVVLMTIALTR